MFTLSQKDKKRSNPFPNLEKNKIQTPPRFVYQNQTNEPIQNLQKSRTLNLQTMLNPTLFWASKSMQKNVKTSSRYT